MTQEPVEETVLVQKRKRPLWEWTLVVGLCSVVLDTLYPEYSFAGFIAGTAYLVYAILAWCFICGLAWAGHTAWRVLTHRPKPSLVSYLHIGMLMGAIGHLIEYSYPRFLAGCF